MGNKDESGKKGVDGNDPMGDSYSDKENDPTSTKARTMKEICDDLRALQLDMDLKAIDISQNEPDTEKNRERIRGLRALSDRIGKYRAENC